MVLTKRSAASGDENGVKPVFPNLSDDKCSYVTRLPVADMEERREDGSGKLLKSFGTIQRIVYSLGPPPVLGCCKKGKEKASTRTVPKLEQDYTNTDRKKTLTRLEKRWVVHFDINIARHKHDIECASYER